MFLVVSLTTIITTLVSGTHVTVLPNKKSNCQTLGLCSHKPWPTNDGSSFKSIVHYDAQF